MPQDGRDSPNSYATEVEDDEFTTVAALPEHEAPPSRSATAHSVYVLDKTPTSGPTEVEEDEYEDSYSSVSTAEKAPLAKEPVRGPPVCTQVSSVWVIWGRTASWMRKGGRAAA